MLVLVAYLPTPGVSSLQGSNGDSALRMKYKRETFTCFVQMSWRALPDRCQQRNSGEDIAIRLTWRNLLLRGSRNGKPDGIQGKITVDEHVTIIKDRYLLVTSSPSWLVMTIFKMLSGQDVSISSFPAAFLTKY